MKRILCILLCVLALAGCVACTPQEEEPKPPYTFKTGGVEIKVGDEVSPILAKLGEYKDYREAPSCYFTGMDKIYIWGAFELHTYPDGGKNYVYLIVLLDDTVQTAEGVRIGASKNDVTKAYGKADKETNTSLIYARDGMYMELFLENGAVIEIQYQHLKVRGE